MPATAISHKRKADQALRDAVTQRPTGSLNVIISVSVGAHDAVRAALAAKGRAVTGEHPSIHAVSATIDAADLADLERDPSVASISLNAVVTAHQTLPNPDAPVTLNVLRPMVGAAAAATGQGVGVAVIDSGIQDRPDLHPLIKAFYDFTVDGTARAGGAADPFGHGTHIAATIASTGQESGSLFRGVATGAQLIGLRVLDGYGNGTTSNVINALAFATSNKAALGIDVINLSLGHPIYESVATDPLVQAVEAAVHAGIVVVVSAGNYGINPATGQPGYGGITSPGNAPSAITVGAVNTSGTLSRSDDVVAPYSSRGPTWVDGFAKPDLVAPGHRLVADTSGGSYLYKQYPAWQFKTSGAAGAYERLSGSSMAAAVASGVAALVLQANRTTLEADGTRMAPLNPYAVKAVLESTATPLAGADPLTQGAGELNADGAVALVRALDTRTAPWTVSGLSPTTTFGAETDSWSGTLMWGAMQMQGLAPGGAVSGANVVWGSNVVWGTNIVWGSNVVWGTNIVWGSNVVWGTNIVWGSNVVWGTNVVWGSNVVWGTNIVWGSNVVWGTSLSATDTATTASSCGVEVCF